MAEASEQLVDDHAALDKVLKQLQAALHRSDLATAHNQLDLFWARLAVHIRAEHLHLFPAVLIGRGEEAQQLVAELRQDHEFFMHGLGRAVEMMRQLLTTAEHPIDKDRLKDIENTILQIEERLVRHNEVEEGQVYHWATTLLSSDEQAVLTERIRKELKNRPSRFTESTWSDGFASKVR